MGRTSDLANRDTERLEATVTSAPDSTGTTHGWTNCEGKYPVPSERASMAEFPPLARARGRSCGSPGRVGSRPHSCRAGPLDHFDARERIKGYQLALAEKQLPSDPNLILSGNFSAVGGMLAMNQLLDSRHEFTALFACNDQMAYGAALSLYRHGLRIPDDVSVVGFDDLYDSRFTLPPLTSVNISIFDVGRSAASAIVDLIEGKQPTAATAVAELVVRESTARNRR